jgi:hypothetical protein
MDTEDGYCASCGCIAAAEVVIVLELVPEGEGVVDSRVLPESSIGLCILFVRSFSCWTAALRPRRVKGRLARPISWECCETSRCWVQC